MNFVGLLPMAAPIMMMSSRRESPVAGNPVADNYPVFSRSATGLNITMKCFGGAFRAAARNL